MPRPGERPHDRYIMKGLKDFFFGTRRRALVSGLACFALVSAGDFLVRNEISIDVFYFLPIFILTWRGGLWLGMTTAVASVFVWLLDERIYIPDLTGQVHVIIWNAVVRLAFFAVVVALIDRLREMVYRERAASKLKSLMIHTVSHEFNNALTGLAAGLFLLKETDLSAGETPRREIYTAMQAAQRKLALYVKNILNEARLEEGRFKIERMPVLLRDLAADVAGSLAEMLRQKEIELDTELPTEPLLVNADSEAMALVISNLIGNAVKYTGSGGRITVRIGRASPGSVSFSVEDSGIGISPEDMERISSGFFRTEEGRARAGGFGLGLLITSELLALHGSRLQVQSEKGKGSRFFFELPEYRPDLKI